MLDHMERMSDVLNAMETLLKSQHQQVAALEDQVVGLGARPRKPEGRGAYVSSILGVPLAEIANGAGLAHLSRGLFSLDDREDHGFRNFKARTEGPQCGARESEE